VVVKPLTSRGERPEEKTKKEPTKVRREARAAGSRFPPRRSRSSTPSTTIHHHSLREHTL